MNTGNISFSEKKVSKIAVLTLVMGIGILIGFAILTVLSIVTEGRLNVVGGLLGCIFVVLAFFCVLWGVMSYDDAKTNQKYKISGICINIVGWRAAAEQIGQATTLFIAGLLLSSFGWRQSFLVYALAFLVLLFFAARVPDDSKVEAAEEKEEKQEAELKEAVEGEDKGKISPVVYLLILFAFLLVVDYVGMENRFSGVAVAIKGASYTGSSNFLSLMLIGATLGGLFYGSIKKVMGFGTVYFGLILMAISNFLFAYGASHRSFVMLVIGLLLIGFPLQLVSPLIFNLLPDLAPANRQPLITSMILIGFNFGAFFSPTIAEWTNHIMGQPQAGLSLAAPFVPYGIGLLVIALVIFIATRRQAKKN